MHAPLQRFKSSRKRDRAGAPRRSTSTRVAFLEWVLAMLRRADALRVQQLLGIPVICANLLAGLEDDVPDLQLRVRRCWFEGWMESVTL